jgi:hypothetical protein
MNIMLICTIVIAGFHPQEISPLINASDIQYYTPINYAEYDYISIMGYYFNPKEKLPEIPEALKGATDYYLIHIKGPIYEDMKRLIESYDVDILEYIPFNTFIAKLDESQISIIKELPFVNWIGNFEPAYKVSPLFEEIKDEKRMVLLLFKNTDVNDVVGSLKGIGCEILNVEVSEYNRVIVISTTRENIAKIAHIPEVMYLEPWLETIAVNQHAQWVTQTWQQYNRRIWAKGVDGDGQVVTTSDTGILTSHNMVRDPAYPINNVGDFPNHRKIIAYKIPSGSSATFGDNAAGQWHGTHTAGIICGEDSYVGGSEPDDGMPFNAKMYFMDIGTSSGGLSVPSNYDNLWLPPYNGNAGGAARVSSNSWSQTSGNSYTSTSRMVDIFMWNHKDFLICYSAANDGPNPNTVRPAQHGKRLYHCRRMW